MNDSLINDLRALVGNAYVVDQPADMAPHLVDWRGRHRGNAGSDRGRS